MKLQMKSLLELTLGPHLHQDLQLYSSDLSMNSVLLEALVWQTLQNT